jgi:hypothetical protein
LAYVGTAKVLGSPRDTLASVIQGEAGNQGLTGMQAVGATIQNRASINFSNYGSDLVSQATARMQFQGQSGNISPNAYKVADDMLAGRNPDPTGGALYYANPGASTASWARNLDGDNSLKIGSHYFTDNDQGIPFQGGGTTFAGTGPDGLPAGTSGGGTGDIVNPDAWGTYGRTGTSDVAGVSSSGFTGDGFGGDLSGNGSTFTGSGLGGAAGIAGGTDANGGLTNPQSGFFSDGLDPNMKFEADDFGGEAAGASFKTAGSPAAGQGDPSATTQFVDNVAFELFKQSEVMKANQIAEDKTATANTSATTKAIAGAAQGLAGASTTISSNWLDTARNLFSRGSVIILGVVIVGGSLWMLSGDRAAHMLPTMKA